MNWRRGGRRSAAYGLFGILVLGGCAGGGDKTDLASNADTSTAPAALQASGGPGAVRFKLVCKPITNAVPVTRTIGHNGGTISVKATLPPNGSIEAARLIVPEGAVNTNTDFTVEVRNGARVYALVTARQGKQEITSFDPESIQLVLNYDRGCKLDPPDNTPAEKAVRLYGFKVKPGDEGKPDPDPWQSRGGKNTGHEVILTLKSLSGYILAQGLVSDPAVAPFDTSAVQPSDSTASSAL